MKNNLNLKLIPKNETEKEEFLEKTIIDYAEGLAKANDLTSEKALEISKQQIKHALNPEKDTIQTHVVSVIDETTQEEVGGIWFTINPENGKSFIYQILIEEAHRGKGYGKAAMHELHEFCKTQGVKKIALSVFGWNTRAFELYKKMGYEIVQIAMRKTLK